MELTAHLDERHVDMIILTTDGTTLAIQCENDSILNVQRHIGAICETCPEIATWHSTLGTRLGVEAAILEG